MSALIRTEAELHACVGKPPPARDVKVIDHIDDGARRWIAASPILFMALAAGAGVEIALAGGSAGFACVQAPDRLTVPGDSLDDLALAAAGQAFGGLFLVPGLSETLRVNGRVEAINARGLVVHVDECYMHCAKALIRSDFWQVSPLTGAPDVADGARFLALATSDGAGHSDLSPKGDPAGLLLRCRADKGLVFADRPGNRRTDSFLNILAQPRVALAALVPGSARIMVVHGTAELSNDEDERAAFAVEGKLPHLVIRLQDARIGVRESAALARAHLWPAAPAPAGLDPAALFAGHVKAHRAQGAGDWAAKAMVSVPGLMRKGLERDYEKNLY